MNIAKKAYCRTFQTAFRAALPVLPYREPKILKSTSEIITEIKGLGLHSALLITDEFLRSSGATAVLENSFKENGIHCSVYDKTRANPTVHNVEEALTVYNKENCECLIAFGGGSSMDCAKAVGARVAYPNKSLARLGGILRVMKKNSSSVCRADHSRNRQ